MEGRKEEGSGGEQETMLGMKFGDAREALPPRCSGEYPPSLPPSLAPTLPPPFPPSLPSSLPPSLLPSLSSSLSGGSLRVQEPCAFPGEFAPIRRWKGREGGREGREGRRGAEEGSDRGW
jgi:hypothetical protein